MIGFVPANYTVDEENGTVSLIVEVISGSLSMDILVILRTTDGQAIGKELHCRCEYILVTDSVTKIL